MIVYADTSALVKLFVTEEGSEATRTMLRGASVIGTNLLARAELGAALARGARRGFLSEADALEARRRLEGVWPTWARIAVDEALVSRAEALAWEHNLRGYDALHLASALAWQERIQHPVTLITFDRELWEATRQAGLVAWPE
jgi:predicted nucleic acid-binding protein